jgi:hypothetical protein
VELLVRALEALGELGGVAELEASCERLRAQIGRDGALVELTGGGRAEAIAALLGVRIVAGEPAAGVRIRLRAAEELTFAARWRDGRAEDAPADESAAMAAALAQVEKTIADDGERARLLAERLQEAARLAAQARVELVQAERERAERSSPGWPTVGPPLPTEPMMPAAPATATPATPATDDQPPTGFAPPRSGLPLEPTSTGVLPRRKRWRLLGWLYLWLRRLFGKPKPMLPPPPPAPPPTVVIDASIFEPNPPPRSPPPPPPATPRVMMRALDEETRPRSGLADRVAEQARLVSAAEHEVERLERELAATKIRLAALSAERDEHRRQLHEHRVSRRARAIARLLELTAQPEPSPLEVDVAAPGVPAGVVLLLRAPASAAEAVDAAVSVDDRDPPALAAELERIGRQYPAELGRRVVAALCSCRNQIADLERGARGAYQTRMNELLARHVLAPDAVRADEHSAAQLPVARHAERIVQETATQLTKQLGEVRAAWAERIDACAGHEQLRAEVAAVETGAAHRLSLVCDELHESLAVQCVRLVLELSRPLRQELLRKRLEVARGRSPKLEETFEDIRVVLPASLEQTFQALRVPDIGSLLPAERGPFDSLFRTLGREKRECVARMGARLDEIEQTTARELFAESVYLSPLLLATFARLVEELVRAHERWIDGRIAEEQQAYDELRARQRPAVELLGALARVEASLARLLEAAAAPAPA